ncbi:hypothetical protein SLEP1_g18509 [Rubroshorea leprosula]|uniref:Uncharacterized protein n=1 Tax=Rubroshorea leprosula TaxID=152421 RepID=A0AAV5J189_9ROSI|nr:hypothetical protein SLEP1_g18509 [Rubroshorea leprosula]
MSVEFFSSSSGSSKSKQPPAYFPQRVSPYILETQNPTALTTPSNPDSDSELDSSLDDNSGNYSYSSESEPEIEVIDTYKD